MYKTLVAIKCAVYNHEPYLRDCLEGFVMQQTNFPFVAIVHDDASTDGSAAIIHEYEEKYPNIIKPIYETENQYSKHDGSLGRIMNAAVDATGAKYVAMCEGDDYWTDPLKLQKQVDFMEANHDYSVSFHRYDIYDNVTGNWRKDSCNIYINKNVATVEITTEMFLTHWVTQPLTMMYRRGLYLGTNEGYKFYRDQHIIFHLLQTGKCMLLNFSGGVYREHQGGIHSKTSIESQCRIGCTIAEELYKKNGRTTILELNYLRYLDWGISVFSSRNKVQSLKYIFQRFLVSFSLKKLIKQLLYII